MMALKFFFASLLLTSGVMCAQSGTVDLRSHGALTLFLEENWKLNTSEFGDRMIVNLEPKDETNANCALTITFPEEDRLPTKAKLRFQVEINARAYEEGSVERKSIVRELNTQAGFGCYCNFTDPELVGKPPQKGNFKVMSVGMVHVTPDVLIEFAISADDFRGKAYQELLGALEGMEYKPRRLADAGPRLERAFPLREMKSRRGELSSPNQTDAVSLYSFTRAEAKSPAILLKRSSGAVRLSEDGSVSLTPFSIFHAVSHFFSPAP